MFATGLEPGRCAAGWRRHVDSGFPVIIRPACRSLRHFATHGEWPGLLVNGESLNERGDCACACPAPSLPCRRSRQPCLSHLRRRGAFCCLQASPPVAVRRLPPKGDKAVLTQLLTLEKRLFKKADNWGGAPGRRRCSPPPPPVRGRCRPLLQLTHLGACVRPCRVACQGDAAAEHLSVVR